MKRIYLIAICFALLTFCIAARAQSEAATVSSPTAGLSEGGSVDTRSGGSEIAATAEQKTLLMDKLTKYFYDYRNAQWRYSWAYHFFIYGAAILSAFAALLTKIQVKAFGFGNAARRENWTASLAAIAALFIAISSAGKLADSWQDNREKRYAVERLRTKVELKQNPTAGELDVFAEELVGIISPGS